MIRERTCITVACDVCEQPLTAFEDEGTIHFPDLAEACRLAGHYRWNALSGGEFVCPERDPEHQAFLDALMPPEPVMQAPGQLAIDIAQSQPAETQHRGEPHDRPDRH